MSDTKIKILILGGTREAAELAHELSESGNEVTTSLAGRTKEPKPVSGQIRIGGFGGAKGLAQYLVENQYDKLIDATHPFATQISANAKIAARLSGVPLEVKSRKPWEKQTGDDWIEVGSLEEARDTLPGNARVLLALGSQYIDLFASRSDVFFLVRMIDQPATPLRLANHKLEIGRPSANWKEEAELLKNNQISHIVCRNSGGAGAYAKIEAARALKLPVIMLKRISSSD